MMKILLLNPHSDAASHTAQALSAHEVVALLPQNPQEALQLLKLHGQSIELAVIHRETALGTGDPGIGLMRAIRQDPATADIPIILTSAIWSDAECAAHQAGTEGANAYLIYPHTPDRLREVIGAVIGQPGMTSQVPSPSVDLTFGGLGAPTASELPTAQLQSVLPSSPVSSPPPYPTLQQSVGTHAIQPEAEGSTLFELPEIRLDGGTQAFEIASVGEAVSEANAPQLVGEISVQSFMLETPPAEQPPSAASRSEDSQFTSYAGIAPPAFGGGEIPFGNPDGTFAGLALPDAAPPEATLATAVLMEPPPAMDFDLDPLSIPDTNDAENRIPSDRSQDRYAEPHHSSPPVRDDELARDMPYLFRGGREREAEQEKFSSAIRPMGDAIVPGGAAQSPDVETLKKYLMLREQDVAALSSQSKTLREQLKAAEESLRVESARSAELGHLIESRDRKIKDLERDKELTIQSCHAEMDEIRFQLKAKSDKVRMIEAQLRDAAQEMEKVKERVRSDIMKIRMREKELENRLEIMKKDAEALLGARETKIIELKRKLDLLEFNMDLLQDKYTKEREVSSQFREKLSKAAQAVRAAGGLLGSAANPVDSGLPSDTMEEDTSRKRAVS